jgi:hypothetical protein
VSPTPTTCPESSPAHTPQRKAELSLAADDDAADDELPAAPGGDDE